MAADELADIESMILVSTGKKVNKEDGMTPWRSLARREAQHKPTSKLVRLEEPEQMRAVTRS